MRILDLFCGAGLVADGLTAAGWEVVGVDIEPQPLYPYAFIQHDALTLDERFIRSFDAIWASPPCLKDTEMHGSARREQRAHGKAITEHPDLITPTQRLVDRLGKKYVIENVRACKILRNPVTLCGSMFGLGVDYEGERFHLERHRKFEANWPLEAPGRCNHQKPCVGVYGGHARCRAASAGGRGTREPWSNHVEVMHEAMGMARRVTVDTLSQGIPPAYAKYVGTQLLNHLDEEAWT